MLKVKFYQSVFQTNESNTTVTARTSTVKNSSKPLEQYQDVQNATNLPRN
jgi:hypothetical protein